MPLPVPAYPHAVSRAGFSRCRRYRYSLVRIWDASRPRLAFCMLNPSTADRHRNDPTVRRCVGFALDRGFGSLEVVNVFALRSTDPAALRKAADAVGPHNNRAIRRAASRADVFVCAWGAHGALDNRAAAVRHLLTDMRDHRVTRTGATAARLVTLGVTAAGAPKHPLYVKADQPFMPLTR